MTAFERAANYIGIRRRTEKEIRTYLVGKGYPLDEIVDAVGRLLEYGYLNDKEFASEYVASYRHRGGVYKIRAGLIKLGVPKKVIDEAVEVLGDQMEEAELIAVRYLRGRELDCDTKAKLSRHLASKGFGWDTVKSVCSHLEYSADDDDDDCID